ncbi:HofP DNA utilization family protein [Pectobacterium cacticida]|uniref:HofP DNA utilization family protein n=1 Tax=Pectobacterium cacticida TaxID=69221 RepID=UPI0039862A8D
MNHIMLSSTLLWLSLSTSVQAERRAVRTDPFQPLAAPRCLTTAMQSAWRLKGVIGTGDRWTGWLARADAEWLKLTSGETIPPGDWLVSQLDRSGAKLVPTVRETGCDGSSEALLLVSPFINKPAK